MKEILNVVYDKNHGDTCLLDLYLPDAGSPCPVFIYFHGGGLESGSKDVSSEYLQMVSQGIALASVNYRIYPHARFPEFIEDAAAAIAFVKEYGGAENLFSEIYAGGSSAGAYLTMMTYFDDSYLDKYGILPDSLDGWIFDAGQPTTHYNVLRERGLDTRLTRIDSAAPLYFIDGEKNAESQSRLMFIVAERDIPNRLEQTKLLLKAMEQFNYDMSKVNFVLMTGQSHCSYSIADRVMDFITPPNK